MAKFEVEGHRIGDLESDLAMSNLEVYLSEAPYVAIFEADGEKYVPVDIWRRFLRDSIRTRWGVGEPRDGSDDYSDPKPSLGSPAVRFSARWNRRRTALVANNPWLGELTDQFVNFVLEKDADARAEQHGQTVTFVMSRGRRAGLSLRAGRRGKGGLWLTAHRNGTKIERWVHSESDFENALAWLQGLPDY